MSFYYRVLRWEFASVYTVYQYIFYIGLLDKDKYTVNRHLSSLSKETRYKQYNSFL